LIKEFGLITKVAFDIIRTGTKGDNPMKLSKTQANIIYALTTGSTLKSHRYVDGTKLYKLHTLTGVETTVRWSIVQALKDRGLIDSNKKFPAATYLLTEKGRQVAERLTESKSKPLSAKNF
jgi:predicted transcriptional regulator